MLYGVIVHVYVQAPVFCPSPVFRVSTQCQPPQVTFLVFLLFLFLYSLIIELFFSFFSLQFCCCCCFKKHYNECFSINYLFFWINPMGLNMDLYVLGLIKKKKNPSSDRNQKWKEKKKRTGMREMKESGMCFPLRRLHLVCKMW